MIFTTGLDLTRPLENKLVFSVASWNPEIKVREQDLSCQVKI